MVQHSRLNVQTLVTNFTLAHPRVAAFTLSDQITLPAIHLVSIDFFSLPTRSVVPRLL